MKSLERSLSAFFTPRAERRGDPHRKSREASKRLALQLGVEVEPLREGGFNVWPPRGLDDNDDPFRGDHYACDWTEVLEHLQGYKNAAAAGGDVDDKETPCC